MAMNKIKKINPNRTKIIIDDFSNPNFDNESFVDNSAFPAVLYNFDCTKGILKTSKGFENITLPKYNTFGSEEIVPDIASLNLTSVEGLIHFREYYVPTSTHSHRLIVYGNDGNIYGNTMFYNWTGFSHLYDMHFDKFPTAINFRHEGADALLLCSEDADDDMKVWVSNYSPYTITDVPTITSACECDGILFCTVGNESKQIWHTNTLDPLDIGTPSENVGLIELTDERGESRKVVSYKGNVFVFRDYGITKISIYNNSFNISHIYKSTSKIFANTVVVCGNSIIFLQRDGLYEFNGVSVNRYNLKIESLLGDMDNTNAYAACLQTKYYLALRCDFGDNLQIGCEKTATYKNNVLLIYDFEKNNFEIIRGIDIKRMLAVRANNLERIFFTFNTDFVDKVGQLSNDGKFFGNNIEKFYSSAELMVEDSSFKTIRRIEVFADSGVVVSIKSDNGDVYFTTYCDGYNVFCPILKCKNFKVQFSATNNVSVKRIEVSLVHGG